MATLEVLILGLQPYEEVWELQRRLHAQRICGALDHDLVILCSHPPVITVGRAGSVNNILTDPRELAARAIQVHHIERGGDVTYHGPGQLIAYLLFDLNQHKKDVSWMMRSMEQVVIDTLQHFDVIGCRIPGKTGVWIDAAPAPRKLCSLGIRISRWCTLHGLALNILPDPAGFSHIHPCGLQGVQISSLAQELPENRYSNQELTNNARLHFLAALQQVFKFENIFEGSRENHRNGSTIAGGANLKEIAHSVSLG